MPMFDAFLRDSEQETRPQAYTLTALFDDVIDAEQTLSQLRRSRMPAGDFSVILREKVLQQNAQQPYRAVLSEVVAKSSLEAAAKWLQGLASLVLPDRATYLTAGPIGLILSTSRETHLIRSDSDEEGIVLRHAPTHQLANTLQAFGFEEREAIYIEQRVVLGSPLIAATSTTVETLRTAHSIIQVNTPVYVGLARTDIAISQRAEHLMAHGPRSSGSVVIADAVSPLVGILSEASLQRTFRDYRGRLVRSRYGEMIGRVSDLLFEPNPPGNIAVQEHGGLSDASMLLRYLILRTSGRFGLGRQVIAIPGERISLVGNDLIVRITHEELVDAPRYDVDATLSRQDEATIRRHFQESFYWITNGE